ncbi:MAG: hypothetical protein RBR41_08635 [Desulfovibrio sp.]|uniref:hypothetical protein n=1 Tax=Desulfovibrio sp. TaxID=885 RepID=UPI002A369BE4|nr:hypothetical protein [Desulfovibrio sp.]MDY0259718.1 hypothetical protein [Desulfovibrio sp.]
MSTLKMHEKSIVEKIFNRGGYVLDFTDNTYSAFFREHRVNIDDPKYKFNGQSKMKRLRAFWEIEPDFLVGRILHALLEYACTIDTVHSEDKIKVEKIINRLLEKSTSTAESSSEDNFLEKTFPQIGLRNIIQDPCLLDVIEQRIQEIQKSIHIAPLATIFLCGSTLEGLLLDIACANPKQFNSAKSAPKKENCVLPFQEWNLASLIDASHELGFIGLDIKKHGHSLRDFRNYIHPRAQATQKFNPDKHTARISWHVLQAAIADLTKKR